MWKDVPALGGRYEASECGEIRNKQTQVIRKARKNKFGYLQMNFARNDGTKRTVTKAVHVLIAETFLDKPEGKCCINHKDGNKANNCVDNLEWVTASENALHAHRTGLSYVYHGSDHARAKLSAQDVKGIRAQYKAGKISQEKLAERYGVAQTTIGRIVRGERYAGC